LLHLPLKYYPIGQIHLPYERTKPGLHLAHED